jgi:hypothetical protein
MEMKLRLTPLQSTFVCTFCPTFFVTVRRDPQNWYYGDVHYYNYQADCWDVTKYPGSRFTSEYGVQSFPSFITLESVSDELGGTQ